MERDVVPMLVLLVLLECGRGLVAQMAQTVQTVQILPLLVNVHKVVKFHPILKVMCIKLMMVVVVAQKLHYDFVVFLESASGVESRQDLS